MFARLHVIIYGENEQEDQIVKDCLRQIDPDFSISPSRPYPFMSNSSEFYITFNIDQKDVQDLMDQLNNDWDERDGEYQCYGFNTKMFHELVYFLGLTLFDED